MFQQAEDSLQVILLKQPWMGATVQWTNESFNCILKNDTK